MKIIVDECISESTIQLLKNVGFDILRINDILYYGVDDERIFDYTSKNQIPLLTHDKRFGFIYYETLETPSTIIILEVRSPHPKATNNLLELYSYIPPNEKSENFILVDCNKLPELSISSGSISKISGTSTSSAIDVLGQL